MQRDIKIGMMIGVVLVIGAILIISVLPSSSMDERMRNVPSESSTKEITTEDSRESIGSVSSSSVDRASEIKNRSSQPPSDINEIHRKQQKINLLFHQVARADQATKTQPASNQKTTASDDTPKTPSKVHIVESGETLSHVSQKYYGTSSKWRLILEANRELLNNNPNLLRPGMRLIIPSE